MNRARFRDWVSSIDELTAARCPGASQVVCAAIAASPAAGLSALSPARRGPGCTARSGGCPLPRCCHRPAAERVRGAVHIQTATSRHSQIKGFLRRFRGIATKCLDSYLRWFHLVVLDRHPSPRACLAVASTRPSLRIAN